MLLGELIKDLLSACLIHRRPTEVENASLHDRLVFLWRSGCAIVGCEFGEICAGDHIRNMAVSITYQSALWIGPKKIDFLPIPLLRDRNYRPRSDKLLGYRRLGKTWRDKTSTEPCKGY
jgi:hypothetical protein